MQVAQVVHLLRQARRRHPEGVAGVEEDRRVQGLHRRLREPARQRVELEEPQLRLPPVAQVLEQLELGHLVAPERPAQVRVVLLYVPDLPALQSPLQRVPRTDAAVGDADAALPRRGARQCPGCAGPRGPGAGGGGRGRGPEPQGRPRAEPRESAASGARERPARALAARSAEMRAETEGASAESTSRGRGPDPSETPKEPGAGARGRRRAREARGPRAASGDRTLPRRGRGRGRGRGPRARRGPQRQASRRSVRGAAASSAVGRRRPLEGLGGGARGGAWAGAWAGPGAGRAAAPSPRQEGRVGRQKRAKRRRGGGGRRGAGEGAARRVCVTRASAEKEGSPTAQTFLSRAEGLRGGPRIGRGTGRPGVGTRCVGRTPSPRAPGSRHPRSAPSRRGSH